MTDKVFEYKSAEKTVTYTGHQHMSALETVDKEGIVCSWTGNNIHNGYNYTVTFNWDFDWTKLKNKGFDSLTGHIIVKPSPSYPNRFIQQKIDIDWKGGKEKITKTLQSQSQQPIAMFEYHLTAHYAEIPEIKKVSYDEMFAASDLNDVVLVVEGKKVHVNKAFLSIHSEFFRALFSSNFKEGQMTEVPIKDVSFQDFGLLMSTVYPNTVFPNDKTVAKLLELADRFLMPSVTAHVEYHLINNSKLSNEKMMWMADAYGMPSLLKKTIGLLNTVEKAKTLEKSPEYAKLSKDAKSSVLDRLMKLL